MGIKIVQTLAINLLNSIDPLRQYLTWPSLNISQCMKRNKYTCIGTFKHHITVPTPQFLPPLPLIIVIPSSQKFTSESITSGESIYQERNHSLLKSKQEADHSGKKCVNGTGNDQSLWKEVPYFTKNIPKTQRN